MKVYTTEKDYFDDLKFWSNAAGDLFCPDSDILIDENELPKELQIAWDYWDENHGIYMYLVQYKGEFGLALTKEYYEYDDDQNKSVNNYDRAVAFAKEVEENFPQHTVFVGKQVGFPYSFDDGTVDKATDMVVFVSSDYLSKTDLQEFEKLAEYVSKNAYIRQDIEPGV